MDIVINLLLFYSKILVALLLFQQVSNQPIKPLWCIIGPFLYVLLLIICPPLLLLLPVVVTFITSFFFVSIRK